MPDSWPIAVAIIVAVAALWDWARKDLQLAHGRMMSADRHQTFERAITQLETRLKTNDGLIGNHIAQIAELAQSLDDVRRRFYDIEKMQPLSRLGVVESELVDVKKNFGVAYGAQDTAIRGWRDFTDQRFVEAVTWQQKAEQSIVLLQGEVDKRDKAIVSCVEEIRAIREQQAMALAGVANLPSRGYAGKQRTP